MHTGYAQLCDFLCLFFFYRTTKPLQTHRTMSQGTKQFLSLIIFLSLECFIKSFILEQHELNNKIQCQRHCWYRGTQCVMFSYRKPTDQSKKLQCLFHGLPFNSECYKQVFITRINRRMDRMT